MASDLAAVATMQAEMSFGREENSRMGKELHEADKCIIAAERALEEKVGTSNRLRADKEQTARDLQALVENVEDTRAKLQHAAVTHTARMEEVQATVGEAAERVSRVSAAEDSIADASKKLSELKERRVAHVLRAEERRARAASLDAELTRLRERLLQAEVDKAASSARLEEATAALQDAHGAAQQAHAAVREAELRVSELETFLTALSEQLATVAAEDEERARAAAVARAALLERLEIAARSKNDAGEALENHRSAKRLERLHADLEAQRQREAAAVAAVAAAAAKIPELRAAASQAEEEIRGLEERIRVVSDEALRQEARRAVAEEQLADRLAPENDDGNGGGGGGGGGAGGSNVQAAVDPLAEQRRQLEELKSSTFALGGQIRQLEDQRRETEERSAALVAAHAAVIAGVTAETDTHNAAIERLEQESVASAGRLSQLEEEAAVVTQRLNEARAAESAAAAAAAAEAARQAEALDAELAAAAAAQGEQMARIAADEREAMEGLAATRRELENVEKSVFVAKEAAAARAAAREASLVREYVQRSFAEAATAHAAEMGELTQRLQDADKALQEQWTALAQENRQQEDKMAQQLAAAKAELAIAEAETNALRAGAAVSVGNG